MLSRLVDSHNKLQSLQQTSLARAAVLFATVLVSTAHAHPTPFSYLDLRISGGQIEGTLVVHIVDLAHDLNVTTPESLLDPAVAQSRTTEIQDLLRSRLVVAADGQQVDPELVRIDPLLDRQALSLELRLKTKPYPGKLRIRCALFPYDPQHQTFLNVYEDE
ncbi:MAG TPA: hypothetical protein VFV34_16070, partial [Blastocatellia bacterium]|nr:hypothetical protein [Blastocatellia bacterium]